MTLTNEDLDAIRKIVDDRAKQMEILISMSFAQFHYQPQQNNPWGPNGQGFGLSAPNPSNWAGINNDNSSFGIAFRKLASVEKLDESEFSKDIIDEFDKSFGSVIKFADFIKLSIAERTEMLRSKINPIIMRKAKECMEKAGVGRPII